jgi:hypothetical protein
MNKDEALRLALEALSEAHYVVEHRQDVKKREQAINAIKEALAQSEQDLVEWGVDWGPDGNSVSIIKRLADGGIEVVGWEYAPHPPQRTWVGLTDEEILLISADCAATHQHTDIHFAKAIEAKLRSKNS